MKFNLDRALFTGQYHNRILSRENINLAYGSLSLWSAIVTIKIQIEKTTPHSSFFFQIPVLRGIDKNHTSGPRKVKIKARSKRKIPPFTTCSAKKKSSTLDSAVEFLVRLRRGLRPLAAAAARPPSLSWSTAALTMCRAALISRTWGSAPWSRGKRGRRRAGSPRCEKVGLWWQTTRWLTAGCCGDI